MRWSPKLKAKADGCKSRGSGGGGILLLSSNLEKERTSPDTRTQLYNETSSRMKKALLSNIVTFLPFLALGQSPATMPNDMGIRPDDHWERARCPIFQEWGKISSHLKKESLTYEVKEADPILVVTVYYPDAKVLLGISQTSPKGDRYCYMCTTIYSREYGANSEQGFKKETDYLNKYYMKVDEKSWLRYITWQKVKAELIINKNGDPSIMYLEALD